MILEEVLTENAGNIENMLDQTATHVTLPVQMQEVQSGAVTNGQIQPIQDVSNGHAQFRLEVQSAHAQVKEEVMVTSSSDFQMPSGGSNGYDQDGPSSRKYDPANQVLPPCKVCGQKGTGFHYGVNTCEPCKVSA